MVKVFNLAVVLSLLQANVSAFVSNKPKTSSFVVLNNDLGISVPGESDSSNAGPPPFPPNTGPPPPPPSPVEEPKFEMFPEFKVERIPGGDTVRTYQMPIWAERCQYFIKTEGRPLRAEVQLWLGPLRNTHTMQIESVDGALTPYKATLKFKKTPTLRIITRGHEFPIEAGVNVPPPARAEALAANTEKLWKAARIPEEKQLIQGGDTDGKNGAYRYWNIPDNVKSVQMLCWSKDTSKKSFKMRIEALQGPNNPKQKIFLQCGGGSQPYHAVLQTPGPGWMVRIQNKKFVEDGLTQVAILPYDEDEDYSPPPPNSGMTWNQKSSFDIVT